MQNLSSRHLRRDFSLYKLNSFLLPFLQLKIFAIPCSLLNVCCQDFLHKLRGVYLKLVQCSHTIAEQYLLSEKSGHTVLVSSWAASSSPWQT